MAHGPALMDTEKFRQALVHRVYHLAADRVVALHKHPRHDEVFYCVKGAGYGVLESAEVPLTPGQAFIVPAGVMHALRTEGDLYVTSTLVPLADDPQFSL
ncbi:MAG TPA: cupin domain-containing protein [Vicinamibacterales bacterium]|nr:cupin domain-containing protein [Vicinamibacterales bacterium]